MASVSKLFFALVKKEWKSAISSYGVRKIGLFGSCLRGEEDSRSDIDVLVDFEKKSFDNYMGLKIFLEDKLGRKVDLIILSAIKPALRDGILKEVKYAT